MDASTKEEMRELFERLLNSKTVTVKSTGWIKLDKRTWEIIPR